MPESRGSESLEELSDSIFREVIMKENLTCILVYENDFDLCRKMEYQLYKLSQENTNMCFYKMKIENYPDKHQISGVPNILFFRDREEVKRIMGVVSESNIRMIIKRLL